MSERDEARYDERIDAALGLLSRAQAPEGMTKRVAAAVRMRQTTLQQAGQIQRSPVIRTTWVWCAAVTAAVIVALWVAFGVQRAQRPAHVGTDLKQRAAAVRPAPPVGPGTFVTKPDQAPTESATGLQRKKFVPKAVTIRGEDSLAREEAAARSYPAPPLPLTEQERLLLRIVHNGDPEEIAMLNPAVRSARDAADRDEVEQFFAEPTYNGGSE